MKNENNKIYFNGHEVKKLKSDENNYNIYKKTFCKTFKSAVERRYNSDDNKFLDNFNIFIPKSYLNDIKSLSNYGVNELEEIVNKYTKNKTCDKLIN